MDATIIDDIVALVPENFRKNCDNINLDTEIESDLGITGDDASEIIYLFSQKFNVDISNFNFNLYFQEEGANHIQTLKTWLFKSKIRKTGRKNLTIGHLVEAVSKGRLE